MTDPANNLIDKILSIKKEKLILISIFIIGFILRLIAAINLGVAADDMHDSDGHLILKLSKLITSGEPSGFAQFARVAALRPLIINID